MRIVQLSRQRAFRSASMFIIPHCYENVNGDILIFIKKKSPFLKEANCLWKKY